MRMGYRITLKNPLFVLVLFNISIPGKHNKAVDIHRPLCYRMNANYSVAVAI